MQTFLEEYIADNQVPRLNPPDGGKSQTSLKKSVKSYYAQQEGLLKTFCQLYNECGNIDKKGLSQPSKNENSSAVPVAPLAQEMCPDKVKKFHSERNLSASSRRVRFAIIGSLVINCLLLALKCVAVTLSGSLTALASLLDSVLDLISGALLVVLNRILRKEDLTYYPHGKKSIEPLGVLVFSCIMAVAAMNVLNHGLKQLVATLTSDQVRSVPHLTLVLFVLATVVVVKFLMYIYCVTLVKGNESCDALRKDHRNDVISNGAGMIGVALVIYLHPMWDDITGILITIYIVATWTQMGWEQSRKLSGRTAPNRVLNQIIFIVLICDQRISGLRCVQAYATGGGYTVDLTINVSEKLPVSTCRDVAEKVEDMIYTQSLFPVDQCFVRFEPDF